MSAASGSVIRRQPSQDRSTQRFELILDTTAALIDESGYRGLSVSHIAKRAAMSGPGIYRYFDDLESIARALATRNLSRFLERAQLVLEDESLPWEDAISGVVRLYCDLCRNEPAFRWLRLGDAIDANLINTTHSNRTVVAQFAAELFVERYEVLPRVDLVAHVEVMVEIIDSLVARAFESDPNGEEFFIAEAERVVIQYLGEYLARPIPSS